MKEPSALTAAVLVIGDEILSGRTQDINMAAIARFLAPFGIDLHEARFVPDVHGEIVTAVNALRARHGYVFTTGGIGPTHDDITTDAVAAAFGLPVEPHPEAMALLASRYKPGEFNEARQRMARVPQGASLIKNPVSVAPGYQIGNVFVLAGVPKIMQAMLEDVAPRLARGAPVISRSLTVRLAEGRIAKELGAIQKAHATVSIGSYPFFAEPGLSAFSGTTLIIRGRDAPDVVAAERAIVSLAASLGVQPENGRNP